MKNATRYLVIGGLILAVAIPFYSWQSHRLRVQLDAAAGKQLVTREECFRVLNQNRGQVTLTDTGEALQTPAPPSVRERVCSAFGKIALDIESPDRPFPSSFLQVREVRNAGRACDELEALFIAVAPDQIGDPWKEPLNACRNDAKDANDNARILLDNRGPFANGK